MNFLDSPGIPREMPVNRNARVDFAGGAGGFLGLLVKGAFLQLLTFGFYRFWLITDLRRHLWSNTVIDGDALEYTGRGRELLIGFLFALAIIGPVFFVFFLVTVEAERLRAFLSLPLYLFLYLFGQFAVYRARRYRLTRTIWRGVRFWMQGSGWSYAFRSFCWVIMAGMTFGLALPWREAALERYKMRNTFYGDLQGSFVGTGWGFFRRGWWIWLLGLLFLAAYVALVVGIAVAESAKIGRDTGLLPARLGNPASFVALAGPAVGLMALLVPVFYAKFVAIETKWWIAGLRFGNLGVESTVRGRSFLWLYVKTWFFSVLVLFGFAMALGVAAWFAASALHIDLMHLDTAAAQDQLQMLAKTWQIPLAIGAAVIYLALLLAFGAVQRFFLQRGVWRLVAKSLTISHIEAADAVVAKGHAVSGFGEGLADGLDVAGF